MEYKETELLKEIRTLKWYRQMYAKTTIKAEEALVDVHRAKEDLEMQEKKVEELISQL